MPLSISNSSERIPSGSIFRMWGLTAFLLLFMLCGSEYFWLANGHLHSVSDTKELWSIHRSRIYTQNGKKALVVVGASRAQFGIDPKVLEEEFPGFNIVHLAVDGSPPFSIMKDICLDPEFNGLILCSTTSNGLLPSNVNSRGKEYLSYYRNHFSKRFSLLDRVNASISVYLQQRLVVFSSQLSIKRIIEDELNFSPAHQHMDSDRFRPAFYNSRMRKDILKNHRKRRIELASRWGTTGPEPGSLNTFRETIQQELGNWRNSLRQRGGKIILVRMPTTDEHWASGEERRPKKDYWDSITHLSGVPTVHFKDYHELSSFDCPDTSHLDGEDAPEFTRRLAHIIKPMVEGAEN